jgi:hypothetical protein
MTLKNLLGFKNLAGLPLLYAGLPSFKIILKFIFTPTNFNLTEKSDFLKKSDFFEALKLS